MDVSIDEIKKLVRETLSGLDESDLITKNTTKSWKDYKLDFEKCSKGLLKKIEDDDYDNAVKDIEKTIDMLSSWKSRIKKNSKDSVIDEKLK
mgnify:CR=1 FL=1|tara:strand:+ start:16846 stop:17121 length:276 start_codon:yes stop_codon:yes gene_type:complete